MPNPSQLALASGDLRIELVPEQPEHVGAVPVGAMAVRSARMLNRGTETVELRVVAASCGCVDVRFGNNVLPPGGTTDVEISTIAVEAPQDQRHYADIEAVVRGANGLVQERQLQSFVFGYTPRIDLSVMPKIVTMHALAGEASTFTLVLRRMDGAAVQLDEAAVPGPWLRVVKIEHDPARRSTYVTLEALSRTPGSYFGWLRLRAAGEAGGQSQAISVNVRVEPRLRSTPSGILLVGGADATLRHKLSLTPSRGHTSVAPDMASIIPPLEGVRCGPIVQEPGGNRWSVEMAITPGLFPSDEQFFGYRYLAVVDKAGNELAQIPIVWLLPPPTHPTTP